MTRWVRVPTLVFILVAFSAGSVFAQATVSYYGHSCFTIQTADGPVVMIDPYATYVKYPGLPQPADIVLMTHAHVDHCPPCYGETDRVSGDPMLVATWDSQGRTREGTWRLTDDFVARFTEASHVTASGGGEGYVALISFEMGGIHFAHLGDLGKTLTDAQVEALEGVEVLFIPVGGAYTIDEQEALTVIEQFPSVRVVIPMHYYVDGMTPWPQIAPLDRFREAAQANYSVVDQGTHRVEIAADGLPEETEVWILDYYIPD